VAAFRGFYSSLEYFRAFLFGLPLRRFKLLKMLLFLR